MPRFNYFELISIQNSTKVLKSIQKTHYHCSNLNKMTTRARIATSRTVSERRSVVLSKHVGPAEPKIQLPLVRDTNILKIQLLITALSGQSTKFQYFCFFFFRDFKQLLETDWKFITTTFITVFPRLFEFSICFEIWDREQDSIQDSIMVRPLI